jgi:hypothetical protein
MKHEKWEVKSAKREGRKAMILSLSLFASHLSLLTCDVRALPSFRSLFERHAGYKTSCRVCHQPGDNRLTPYGRDYRRLGGGAAALEALDMMDPDQDGVPSKNEIALRANPGDPRSTPDHVGHWLADLEPAVPPAGHLRAVFGPAVELSVSERPLAPEQVEEAEAFLGGRLRAEERQPTLFPVRRAGGRELVGYAAYAFFGRNKISSLLVIMLPAAPEGAGPIVRDVRSLRMYGDQRLAKENHLRQFEGRTYATLQGVAAPRRASRRREARHEDRRGGHGEAP